MPLNAQAFRLEVLTACRTIQVGLRGSTSHLAPQTRYRTHLLLSLFSPASTTPPTPTPTDSPSSTEPDSSGDRTIQMSTPVDVPTPPGPFTNPVPEYGDKASQMATSSQTSTLHPVGVFAQTTSVFAASAGKEEEGLTAVVYPHRKIRIKRQRAQGSDGDSLFIIHCVGQM
jgi:hypothetical protein